MTVEVNPLVLLGSFALALVAPTLTVYLLLAYRLETGLDQVRSEIEEHRVQVAERIRQAVEEAPRRGPERPSPARVEADRAPTREEVPALPSPDPLYLVVDDSSAVRRAVVELLAQQGVDPRHVSTAASGSEALEFIRENRPDVVLLDADLPDIDGHHVARQIRALDPEAAIVAITALGQEDPRVQDLGETACGVVEKPVEKRDLADLDELVAKEASSEEDSLPGRQR